MPRFDRANCPFKLDPSVTPGRDVRCGYLTVPEYHARPSGQSLRLAVAISTSRLQKRPDDPVIFLGGGPGDPALGTLGPSLGSGSIDSLVGARDLVLIDQRGTGFSQPFIGCPEVVQANLVAAQAKPNPTTEAAGLTKSLRACRARIVKAGVDPSAYTTPENALDMIDLIHVLGYSSVNLYGLSYGTRLALTVMRFAPAELRSVVLDAVFPPTQNSFAPGAAIARSFKLLFAQCAGAAKCRSGHPSLQASFDAVVTRLDRSSVQITVHPGGGNASLKVWLTGQGLASLVFEGLYDWQTIPILPDVIWQANHGRYGGVAKLYERHELALAAESWGMHYSVMCSEDAPFTTISAITKSSQGLAKSMREDFRTNLVSVWQACKTWNVSSVGPAQKKPVSSTVPTMLMNGEFDPVTLPAATAAAAKSLSHAYSYPFPGMSHGVVISGHGCPTGMVLDLWNDPTHAPGGGCLKGMGHPFK